MEEILNIPNKHLSLSFTKKKMLKKINIKEIEIRNDPKNNLYSPEHVKSKNKHSNNNKYTAKNKNTNDDLNSQISSLSCLIDKYTYSSKRNLYIIKTLKEENQHLINELNSHILKKSFFSKTTEQVFQDLIDLYKKKGYKIPNLTIEKNLFSKNPLLIESKQDVDDYYRNNIKKSGEYIVDIDKYNEKNWVFLNKINKQFVKSYDFTKLLNSNNDIDNINNIDNITNINSSRKRNKSNRNATNVKSRSSIINTAHIVYINSSEINEANKNSTIYNNKLLLKDKKEQEELIKDIVNLKKLIKIEGKPKNKIANNTDNNKNYSYKPNCTNFLSRKSDKFLRKNLLNINLTQTPSNKSLTSNIKFKSNKKLGIKYNKILSYHDKKINSNSSKKQNTLITSLNISSPLSNKSSARNSKMKDLSYTEKIYKKLGKLKFGGYNSIENEVIQYLKSRKRCIPKIRKENLNTEVYWQLEDLRGKIKDGRILTNAQTLYCFGNSNGEKKYKKNLETLTKIEKVINKIDKIYVKSRVHKSFE